MPSIGSLSRRLILVLALLIVPGSALAQEPGAGAQKTQADVAGLAQVVDQQRKLLEMQARLIEELTKRLEETNKLVTASQQRLADLEQRTSRASGESPEVQQRLRQIEQSIRVLPELTQKELAKLDEFPGSLKIPGTDAAVRFGGQVRTVFVRNIGALGSEDRFITSSIPIEGTAEAGKESRTTLSASPSRMETDFRTPTPGGQLRAYVSGDFAGSNRTYRLRHAFGQWRSVLIGQTWSAFSDPEAEPDGLDFEGLNAISLFRQPGIRWTKPLTERIELALAIENPSPDITGAAGVNQVPDFIARLRFNAAEDPASRRMLFRGAGHTQAALLFRQLRGEPDDRPNEILSTSGVGVHVSGRLRAPWRQQDYLKFATAAGKGIGRYITDLGTVGGQDAVYDPDRIALVPLPVYSAYVGYEHSWTETLRSTGTFGIVHVDNLDIQADAALHETTRSSFNISWSPVQRVDLIAEFLAGRRVNKDRQDGRAGQLQLGWIFRF
jgi:DcaP outer membrane protein